MIAADLFAGFGGFTEGAEQAGVRVVWAANHWQTAVDVHAENHPHVEHSCQDLMQADWRSLPRFDLLLAGPACQGHSSASQPRRGPAAQAQRTTAWAVVECVEVCRPKAFVVENVPRFLRWQLFSVWRLALETLGYGLHVEVVDASKLGVPQLRKRVVISGLRGRTPRMPALPSVPRQSFERCLDGQAEGWRPIVEAGSDARDRMARAARRWGRCLVQHVTGHGGVPLSEPIRTITTKRQWCLVDGDRYRWLTPRELARAQGFPDSFKLPAALSFEAACKGIGNAIPPPMAAFAVRRILEAA